VFGRVFDRHPKLQVVFVEAGISWVPNALHGADVIYNTYTPFITDRPDHHPSWYWFNHCYATFMIDPMGLNELHRMGADRVMWTHDYPHPEGTHGYTQDAIQAVFNATTVENAQKILGGTAIKVFSMS
jgi:predicted TIM-barrel fold metal-dependent hydrolase